MRSTRYVAHTLVVSAALFALAGPVEAARSKTYENEKLGFKLKIDGNFSQIPPKLTDQNRHIVGTWFADQEKYKSSRSSNPEIEVMWFPTPKQGAAVTPSETTPDVPDLPEEVKKRLEEMGWNAEKSLDGEVDRLVTRNPRLFGKHTPMAKLWKDAKTVKTAGKNQAEVVEINAKKAKKGAHRPLWYLMVARIKLDRPQYNVEVGFVAHCDVKYQKKLAPVFQKIVKSFAELEDATNTGNVSAGGQKVGEAFREFVKKEKVIEGWASMDTENYLILYNKEVSRKLVNQIATQIEAIRRQIYEKVFPPDGPITAVSVVRVCRDSAEYRKYGGPPGSAGYWSWPSQELVFYEDTQGGKRNTKAVLYHEAFHQYIFYSVGHLSPHSWFNEGHGDYFAGHKFKGGRFKEAEFIWRKDLAKTTKKNGEAPPLKEWLHWTQRQYYGANDYGLRGGVNYALGWDFIYFLRTTGNPEYKKILPRYFDALKRQVTELRKELEAEAKEEGNEFDEGELRLSMMSRNAAFLTKAIEEGFKGIDLTELERDWLKR